MSSSSTIAIYSTFRPGGRREDRCSEAPHLDAPKSPAAKSEILSAAAREGILAELFAANLLSVYVSWHRLVSLARDDTAYTTREIFNGAPAMRGQMGVAVEDGLPRSLAVVDTDGESFHASIRLLGGLLLLPQETGC